MDTRNHLYHLFPLSVQTPTTRGPTDSDWFPLPVQTTTTQGAYRLGGTRGKGVPNVEWKETPSTPPRFWTQDQG